MHLKRYRESRFFARRLVGNETSHFSMDAVLQLIEIDGTNEVHILACIFGRSDDDFSPVARMWDMDSVFPGYRFGSVR